MSETFRCSDQSVALAEPLAGTAGVANRYLVIEQGGPWGRDALNNGDLDHHLANQIARLAAQHDVKVLMIRRPGRHTEHGHRNGRAVYAACINSGSVALLAVVDPIEILEINWAAYARDDPSGVYPRSQLITDPVVLVCAHSKRDLCCAVKGRPLARQLREKHGNHVWECSHLGGHRFAATALILPSGATYGRLNRGNVEAVYQAAVSGTEIPQLLRGMSALAKPAQAADVALRTRTGRATSFIDILSVGDVYKVRFGDESQIWTVTVRQDLQSPPRAQSCGKDPVLSSAYFCTDITAA
ncbi:MAG: sucrase ferredoxin [Antricoccus sp.]